MKRLILCSFVFVALPGLLAGGQSDRRQQLQEAQKLAQKVLAGRSCVVRVYKDSTADPCSFELVRVALDGLSVGASTIKSAFPAITESSFIAILGQEQTDAAVSAVMRDFFVAGAFKETAGFSIWPPLLKDPGERWWSFLDALGEPIPEASVDVRLLDTGNKRWILLCTGVLGEDGRLKQPQLMNSRCTFTFGISHPDYGQAEVGLQRRGGAGGSPGTYVLPLVRLDSEAAGGCVEAVVTDPEGRPVAGAVIRCMPVHTPDGRQLTPYSGSISVGVTDRDGWFAVYMPVQDVNGLSSDLIPAGSRYSLFIEPPKALNLGGEWATNLTAGTIRDIVLRSLPSGEYFHRFAFEDMNGPITEPEELDGITISLAREGRQWLTLKKHESWKDGVKLPPGTLRASVIRRGYPYSFAPIEVTPESPEELVFKPYRPMLYKGNVVEAESGKPMADVLILAGWLYQDAKSISTVTAHKWDTLLARAVEGRTKRTPEQELYDNMERVTLTDVNGCFELLFLPGFHTALSPVAALAEGYERASLPTSWLPMDADGVVRIPTLRLLAARPPIARYRPSFVFESETGPVSDPEMLKQINLVIGNGYRMSYTAWRQRNKFIAGVYRATADWEGKHYVFEPVDLTTERPEQVVFKVKSIAVEDVVCRGRVVNGVTGAGIAGAIIMAGPAGGTGNVSRLSPEHWQAFRQAGPDPNALDPVFASLKETFAFRHIKMTDASGSFELALPPGAFDKDVESFVAVAKDYLCARYVPEFPKAAGSEPVVAGQLVEVEGRELALPPMKLFPAATIIIEPVIPGSVGGRRDELRLRWYSQPNDKRPWVDDMLGRVAPTGPRSYMFYEYRLESGSSQSFYVPADIDLDIKIWTLGGRLWCPISIGGVKLDHGQVVDLGRREFTPAVQVKLWLVDSANKALARVRGNCLGEDGRDSGQFLVSDESGMIAVGVPPNSRGRFVVRSYDRAAQQSFEQSMDLEVGGPEDTGREFTLRLSDELVAHLFE